METCTVTTAAAAAETCWEQGPELGGVSGSKRGWPMFEAQQPSSNTSPEEVRSLLVSSPHFIAFLTLQLIFTTSLSWENQSPCASGNHTFQCLQDNSGLRYSYCTSDHMALRSNCPQPLLRKETKWPPYPSKLRCQELRWLRGRG